MKSNPYCTSQCRDLSEVKPSAAWVHVAQEGEYPGSVSIPAGYKVEGLGIVPEAMEVEGMTVFNKDTLDSILIRYNDEREMLIDYEHFSHDPSKKTEAAGWGIYLRKTPDRKGLELETRWAAPARQEIVDQVYRYISPEFSGAVRYEDGIYKFYPSALTGAGLTNRPKLTVLRPVSINREKQNITPMNYKNMLAMLLGVAATATDDEIQTAYEAYKKPEKKDDASSQNQVEQLNRQLSAATTELKELKAAQIDADLVQYADVIADKDSTRELLQLNRAVTIKSLAAQQANKTPGTKKQEPIYQKNRATTPDPKSLMEGEEENEEVSQTYRKIQARANAIAAEKKIPFSQAFAEAKALEGV